MSLKLELETWAAALKAYDEEDFDKSLQTFSRIAESSKILTNIGLIYATLGEHETAVQFFREAVTLDKYLAVAYFQCGVSNFLLGRYEEAHSEFKEALLYLRGNQAINYEQLGLKFRLYSAEVLFNKGLCLIYLGRVDEGLRDMRDAQAAKVTEEHGVIDEAIQDRGEGYTVFSIPVGILYRPSESKLKNAKTKDFLGKAQLIAASDAKDAFTTFTGVTRLQQGLTPSGAPIIDGRPIPPLSRAVTAAARVETTQAPKDEPKPDAPTLQKSASIGPGDPTRKPGLSRNPSMAGPGLTRNPTSAADLSRNTSASGSSGGGPLPNQGQGPPRLPRIEPLMTPERSRSPQDMMQSPVGRDRIQSPVGRDRSQGPSGSRERTPRMTEFYDEYLGAYEEPAPPMPEGVAAWAAKTKGAPPPPSGPPSRSGSVGAGLARGYDERSRSGYERSAYDERSRAPPSSYGGSSMSLRRKMSRRPTRQAYEEEEEGYVSGEYSDAPFELVKIRVKLHYKDDVRGMAISPEMRFEEFLEKVSSKFGRAFGTLGLKFKDEDGGRVSLRDDSDYELAIETARESAKGRPEGKLEIWCTDE
ncbi:neutrophil cytosol factor 2 [Ceratobasidium sp. AG-Ba]|nr:neutrophil cytosol factor 2 [Ceratobasidium sp. AG-Ba]